ncbi:hypothetical protein [Aeropyrum camini]|uniref:hypothetical protein n=1 Tax=Aeropyrum camini TaxID=229980 RepID=UPI00130D6396|nr:hypothetical protein [Aeropyrum camini]
MLCAAAGLATPEAVTDLLLGTTGFIGPPRSPPKIIMSLRPALYASPTLLAGILD